MQTSGHKRPASSQAKKSGKKSKHDCKNAANEVAYADVVLPSAAGRAVLSDRLLLEGQLFCSSAQGQGFLDEASARAFSHCCRGLLQRVARLDRYWQRVAAPFGLTSIDPRSSAYPTWFRALVYQRGSSGAKKWYKWCACARARVSPAHKAKQGGDVKCQPCIDDPLVYMARLDVRAVFEAVVDCGQLPAPIRAQCLEALPRGQPALRTTAWFSDWREGRTVVTGWVPFSMGSRAVGDLFSAGPGARFNLRPAVTALAQLQPAIDACLRAAGRRVVAEVAVPAADGLETQAALSQDLLLFLWPLLLPRLSAFAALQPLPAYDPACGLWPCLLSRLWHSGPAERAAQTAAWRGFLRPPECALGQFEARLRWLAGNLLRASRASLLRDPARVAGALQAVAPWVLLNHPSDERLQAETLERLLVADAPSDSSVYGFASAALEPLKAQVALTLVQTGAALLAWLSARPEQGGDQGVPLERVSFFQGLLTAEGSQPSCFVSE